MSTHTAPPLGATGTAAEGNDQARPRWRRITVIALVVALALVVLGGVTWQFVVAPQILCKPSAATDPTRSGAVTEYCLPNRLQSTNGGAMTVGPDGNLWVAYYAGNTIARVTPQGVLTEFAVSPPPAAPGIPFSPGIIRGPDGALWYMAAGKLVRLNISGQVVGVITPPADMARLGSITVGPDGAIWVANYIPAHQGSSDRIAKVTPTGQFTEYRLPSEEAAMMVAGSDGAFWLPVDAFSTIGRLTPEGSEAVITRFPPNTGGQITGHTAGPGGNIWFIDFGGHVGRMTPTGDVTLFTVAINPRNSTTGPSIGPGPDGNVWFSYEPGVIGRITPSGAVTQFPLPHRDQISAITAGPDGSVWFLQAPADFPASFLQPARIVRINV
jgi:streptogramin lyase